MNTITIESFYHTVEIAKEKNSFRITNMLNGNSMLIESSLPGRVFPSCDEGSVNWVVQLMYQFCHGHNLSLDPSKSGYNLAAAIDNFTSSLRNLFNLTDYSQASLFIETIIGHLPKRKKLAS